MLAGRLIRFSPLILVAVFAIFATVRFAERAMVPGNATAIPQMTLTHGGSERPISLVHNRYVFGGLLQGEGVFSTPFGAIGAAGHSDRGILLTAVSRWPEVWLCGERISPPAKAAAARLYKPFDPYYIDLPSAECEVPILEIRVDTGPHPLALHRVYIGPAEDLQAAFRWRRFFAVDTVIIATGLILLTGLFAFVMTPLQDNKRLFVCFVIVLSIWATRNFYYIGLLSDLGRESFDLWFYLTTMGLSLASLIFVDTWTADRPRIGVRGIVVLCAGGLIILGVYLLGGQGTRQVAWYVNYGFNACLLIGVTVMLLTFGLRGTPLERAVAVLFLVATWGGMVDLIGSVSQPLAAQIFGPQGLTAPHAHLMPVPAILGFALLLHRRNMAVTTALADRGALLEAQLAEREAEIQAVYRTREAEQRETAILRERQRIMADVHDGFGGRLLALLLQVDNGEVDPTKLSAGLRESLQDLRLIIDSLDTADSDLSVALGALRGRLEPQVRAAGFELVWKVERFSGLRLSPRKTLSLYRVIQEAVTNALRHSGGSCVTLEMTRADSETLDLRIADNGRGFAPPSAATVDPIKETSPLPGKGLSNIRRRLRAFDASLEVSTAPTGSCLMAVIPIAAALAPAP